jgi:hypothetical protein
MRTAAILLVLLGVLAVGAQAAERGRPRVCCDLWIFEPSGGRAESYAIEVRGSGQTVAVDMSLDAPPRLYEGQAARTRLRAWAAASRKPGADSVLITGPDVQINLEPIGAEDEMGHGDPRHDKGDNLVLVQRVPAAKAHAFVDEIDQLPPEMSAAMKAVIPAR